MIGVASPIIGKEEIKAVNDVLKSGILAQGPKVAELEDRFAKLCGTKYAVAVSNGTAALHAALFVAGVGPGDEVITVPFSFIATINPILMVGAKPVLVDIDPTTFNMDMNQVKKAIGRKTKAIIPVHLYGQPADMTELKKLCREKGIAIIEDACQAVDADYKGKKAGNLGDLGCFSLYATKNIMSGEGGMVTTNNKQYMEALKRFRQHGMSAQYEYAEIGYNYRMTDLQAAIAVEQVKKVHSFTKARQKNALRLNKALAQIPGIVLPVVAKNRTHVYHQYTIRVTEDFVLTRAELAKALLDRGIGTGMYYPKPLHAFPHIQKFGYKLGRFPEAEVAANECLALPVHPKVTPEDIKKIAHAFKELC